LHPTYELPCAIFINKLDRERADFTRTVEDAVQCLSPKPIIVQLPIGAEADFNGIVDLVGLKAYHDDTAAMPRDRDPRRHAGRRRDRA
jgi:elongation factor G